MAFIPQDVFYNYWLKQGVLPLWNPQIFSGHPFSANGWSATFYPFRILFHWVFAPGTATTLSQMFHLLGMGLAMHWFLRLRGFDQFPCFVGGFAWMGNTFALGWLEFEHVPVAGVYLPLLMVALEKALSGPPLSRWWLALPVLGSLSLQSGHLQLHLYIGLLFGMYAFYRLYQERSWAHLAKFLGIGVLTLGLSGPTLLPFLEFASESQRGTLNADQNAASLWSLVLSFMNPDLFGNPAKGFMINRCQANLVYPEFACFSGTVPLVFALAARGRQARVLQAVVVFCLLVASATIPPLPVLGKFIPGRVIQFIVFCVAMLAAMGAQQFVEGKVRVKWPAVILGLIWVSILGFILYLLNHPDLVLNWCSNNPRLMKLPPAAVGQEAIWKAFVDTFAWNPQLLLPLVAYSLLIWAPQRSTLLVAVTFAELLLFGFQFNTRIAPEDYVRTTPEIQALQKAPGRVVAVGCANYNTLTPYGISVINGYDSFVSRRYGLALSQASPGAPISMRSANLERLDLPMIDALAVSHAIFPPDQTLEAPGWELEFEGEGGRVYKNNEAVARCFLVGRVRPLQRLDELQSFDPAKEAFVSSPPPSDIAPGDSEVTWLMDTPNDLRLRVSTETPQLLVLTDTYHAGWHCSVDGVEQPVFPANLTSRGTYLRPGTHNVRFWYAPKSLTWGLRSLGGSLLIIVVGFVGLSLRKKTN